MKKKLADILDRNGEPTNKGDYVFVLYYPKANAKNGLPKILGKITRINGGYIYVQNVLNKENVWELYSVEIEKATPEEVTLWMLENS